MLPLQKFLVKVCTNQLDFLKVPFLVPLEIFQRNGLTLNGRHGHQKLRTDRKKRRRQFYPGCSALDCDDK